MDTEDILNSTRIRLRIEDAEDIDVGDGAQGWTT